MRNAIKAFIYSITFTAIVSAIALILLQWAICLKIYKPLF
jgi:hypothetical protein